MASESDDNFMDIRGHKASKRKPYAEQKEEAVQVAEKMRQEGKWPEAQPPPAEELPPQWEDLTPEQKERFSLNVRTGGRHHYVHEPGSGNVLRGNVLRKFESERTWEGEPYKRSLPIELRGVGKEPETKDLEYSEDKGITHQRGWDPSKTLGEDISFTDYRGREVPTVVQGVEGGETPEEAYAIRRKRLDDMAQRAEEIGGRYGMTGFFPRAIRGPIEFPEKAMEDWSERFKKAAGLKEDSGISWMDLAELVDAGRMTVKPELQNLLEEAKRMDRDLEEMRQLYKSYRAAEPELALLEQEFPELKKEAMKRIMDKHDDLLPKDESTDLDKE